MRFITGTPRGNPNSDGVNNRQSCKAGRGIAWG